MVVLGLLLLFSSFLGGLFRLCLIDGCWSNEGDFFPVFLWHVHLESIGNSNASLGLVHLHGLPVAHPQPPRLVVKAVAAADKFPESSPSREPRFEVELFGSRIIQSTRNDGHDPVRDV